jgi:hypothetical protein
MAGQERLPFELDDKIDDSLVTAHAGVPLLIELFRSCGAAREMDAQVVTKRRKRGLSPSELAEGLFALWLAGGERCEDLEVLREDAALAGLLGHGLPAAQTARDFLDAFHAEELPLLQQGERASVPAESAPLAGLGEVNRKVLATIQQRLPQHRATLDVDATVLECAKRSALLTYDGRRGYQPVVVAWAEADAILTEEFRDGNVPAGSGNLRVVHKALAMLPAGVGQVLLRGDSALYEHELMDALATQGVGFAISADMSRELRGAIEALPEQAWRIEHEERDAVRQWAEVMFVSSEQRSPQPHRYLALRILKRQGCLFADGSDRKHFCIVTNRPGDGGELIRWHRGKAGTIEHIHHVLTNELAAEALPSQHFGANAAWLRLNALLYNLLSLLKRIGLPPELHNARPKRLRFLLFNTIGRVIRHGGDTLLRLSCALRRRLFDAVRLAIPPPPALAGE